MAQQTTRTQPAIMANATLMKWAGEVTRPNAFKQGTAPKRHFERNRRPGRVHMRP